jgi:hypothetical protein
MAAAASVVLPPLAADVRPVPAPAAFALHGVNLTPEGYGEFRRAIDHSLVPFATRRPEFDGRRIHIPQGRSEMFVWHFTAMFVNHDGASSVPEGDADVKRLILSMARRGDTYGDRVCCGVNWFIARDGTVYRLAGLNAKLRHNPPFDSVMTGVEVEAATQRDITTTQYEQLAYLTLHVLQRQQLLGTAPLRRLARGHGEVRDAYLERNPNAPWDPRDDFDAPVSELLRDKIAAFLREHPEVAAP